MADIFEITGRIHSTSQEHVTTVADEILDETKGKKQSQINAETDATLAKHTSTINGLNSQNYVTVTATDQTTAVTDVLPATGEVATVYRVGNWDGSQYDVTCYSEYAWDGTQYKHLSTKTQIGEVFDISAYHATGGTLATYADLSAALDSDNGGGVPQSLQKDGMRIQFVHAYDNKYVQFRYMGTEVTGSPNPFLNTDNWSFCGDDVLVDNPEYMAVYLDAEGRILKAIKNDGTEYLAAGLEVKGDVKTDGSDITMIENPEFMGIWLDKDNKILFGVQNDGNFYFGCGVPQQVIDYINNRLEDLSLDEYEDIVAFLNGLETGDKTLQDLLDEKVDKEEGKSLIDAEYASTKSTIDNPEFLDATLDEEDKVLEGIKKDGTKVIGGDLNVGGSAKVLGEMEVAGVSYKVIENPEYLAAWVDADNKVVFGLKTDGKTYICDADFLNDIKNNKEAIAEIKTTLATIGAKVDSLDIDALSSITVTDNPEYISVVTDSKNKVLAGRTPDGAAFENVGFSTPKVSIDGHHIKNIEDPERRNEITTDSEGKIVSYRDSDGVKHEEVGIETDSASINHLNLTNTGMTEFQQALKNAGFQPGGGSDWSDREVIELPEPEHYALLDIAVSNLPLNDGEVSEGYITYYDGLGNYFKIECSLEPQGQSSRIFARTGGKGNYTLDLPKDIKFGSWVPQDSFHLKGAAKDVTKCYLPTSYKWAYKVMNYLNAKPNRVLSNDEDITYTDATGDRFTDWGDSARCISDGFPVEVYLNGEYWGLYNLQLKKHRKNYSMDKKDYTSFFIDADKMMSNDYTHGIWNDGPDAVDPDGAYPKWWNGFDIKGPKDLICMDGSEFDGDNPKELIDSTSPVYNASNKKHKGSATTKALIRGFQTKYLEVKTLIDNNDIEGAKAKFNENFDYNACMLVYIFNSLMGNSDSVKKNTLWGVYKEGKIAPMLWDIDGIYGEGWIGIKANNPNAGIFNTYHNAQWPLKLLWDLYETEIKDTYCDLREQGIISIETWRDIIFGWINRVGIEAYDRDIKKWPNTPSYRENYTNTDYWQEVGTTADTQSTPLWNDSTNYNINDQCRLSMGGSYLYMIYKAVSPNINVCPVTAYYEGFPNVGGYYNSPKRMEKWMQRQIELCDSFCGYNE